MDIAGIIKKRRGDLGITQHQLAELSGLQIPRIGQIEREIHNVTWDEVTKIAKVLGITHVKAWETIDRELETGV